MPLGCVCGFFFAVLLLWVFVGVRRAFESFNRSTTASLFKSDRAASSPGIQYHEMTEPSSCSRGELVIPLSSFVLWDDDDGSGCVVLWVCFDIMWPCFAVF